MLNISKQTLKRLPLYLNYLKALRYPPEQTISATSIAEALGLNDVQVRKDLASVCSLGKPKTGYCLSELVACITSFLGYDNTDNAVLVGAGKLGKALMNYSGFRDYGLDILFAFDDDEAVVDNKKIFPLHRLRDICQRMHIHIGIITVPAEAAQSVCDLFVEAGIIAVWNFAPVHLIVPEGVLVQNENMASSLTLLSQHLKGKLQ